MNIKLLMVAGLMASTVAIATTSQQPAAADRPGHRPMPSASYELYVVAANGAEVTATPAGGDVIAELEESTQVRLLDTEAFTGSTYYYIEVVGNGTRGWMNANILQRYAD